MARWFVRKAAQYAKDRVVFGAPIGKNQAVQFPIARAWAETGGGGHGVPRGGGVVRRLASECGADANIAKLLASEAAWKAADTAMQTFGGFAYAREYEIERKWREVRLYPDRADLDQSDPGLCRAARAGHAAIWYEVLHRSGCADVSDGRAGQSAAPSR